MKLRKEMVEDVQRDHHKSVFCEKEERRKGKFIRRRAQRPEARQTLGKSRKWLFLSHFAAGVELALVPILQYKDHRKMETVIRLQQEVQSKKSRRMETIPKRWKQLEGEDRTEMKKRSKTIEVYLVHWVDAATPTVYEPKELAIVSRIEAYSGDPNQLY